MENDDIFLTINTEVKNFLAHLRETQDDKKLADLLQYAVFRVMLSRMASTNPIALELIAMLDSGADLLLNDDIHSLFEAMVMTSATDPNNPESQTIN